MIVGCYCLHLYCSKKHQDAPGGAHTYGEFPHEYTHELGSVCRKRARKAGWKLNKDGSAICPKCSGKKIKK